MAIETFKILNNMSPPVLSDLIRILEKTYNFCYKIIFYRYLELEQVISVRKVLGMLQPFYGTASQMNLEG